MVTYELTEEKRYLLDISFLLSLTPLKKSRTTYFLRDRRSKSHIVSIAQTFADPPPVHPYLPSFSLFFLFLFGLPPLFGPVFPIFPSLPSSFSRSWEIVGGRNPTERRPFPRRGNFVYPKLGQLVDRGFNVGDFCEIWKGGRRLCAHGWLCFVISFRGGRLCVAQCWWWSNRFCATIGWKSCILEMIDIVFDTFFQFIENFIEISFFLSERKKSQVPLMSLENFLNLFFQVINRIKMKIR